VVLQRLADLISRLVAAMYDRAPLVAGSRWPMFLVEGLVVIVLIDLVIFGWRPLIRRFMPAAYSTVDYVFGQFVNALAFLVLVAFLLYIATQLGTAWGTFLGLPTMIWSVIGFIALIFVGRLVGGRGK